MNKLGNPNNLHTRKEALNEAVDEIGSAADSLYYAAKLLAFCSHSSASKIAGLADQILVEMKKLNIKD